MPQGSVGLETDEESLCLTRLINYALLSLFFFLFLFQIPFEDTLDFWQQGRYKGLLMSKVKMNWTIE